MIRKQYSVSVAAGLFLVAMLISAFILPVQAEYTKDIEKRQQEARETISKLEKRRASQIKVYFCAKDLKKGERITAQHLDPLDVYPEEYPGDAANNGIIGQVAQYDINKSALISVRDFGIALTKPQLAALTARDYKGAKGEMAKIVFARNPIAKGAVITAADTGEAFVPTAYKPIDAVPIAGLAQGRKSKYGKPKFQIFLMHELCH